MSEDYCPTCSDGCCLDHERLLHAEAVAAQLVEVICEQDAKNRYHVETKSAWRGIAGDRKSERDAARAEVAALQDALEDVIGQACFDAEDDGKPAHLDSKALSAYAHGMRVLAERGRIVIEEQVGRRVIGRWVAES